MRAPFVATSLLASLLLLGCAASSSGIRFVPVGDAYLSETEVTVAQFRRFVDETGYRTDAERGTAEGEHTVGAFAATPDGNRDWHRDASWRNAFPNLPDVRVGDEHPVVHVSWNDAQAFCRHYGLRLPTEAEWNVAVAGGAGEGNLAGDPHPVLAPVRSYAPNARGLYDLAGNVAEWCHDPYAPGGEARVVCGNAWVDGPEMPRVGMEPYRRRDFIGFRVAKDRP